MGVTLNTKEQERKITIWAHKTLTLSKCLCNYVIFMTVAPDRGGCGGVGSQRTIPLSAQMIVVLQTLAPEGKKNTHIVTRLHRNEASAFLRNLMRLPLRTTAPQHCGTPWDASLTPDLQGIEVSAAHFVSSY